VIYEKPIPSLIDIGFSSFFQSAFARYAALGLAPARVAAEHRGRYVLLCEHGAVEAEPSGRLLHGVSSRDELAAVGDWVAFRATVPGAGVVHAVLPRRTAFVRAAAGARTQAQVVAANVDLALLVCGLDRDFNVRRIERYLSSAHASGADAVIVLTKRDGCEDAVDARLAAVAAVAGSVPVHAVSSVTGAGMDALAPYLAPGRTLALLGSSGAGKSTLVNVLAGGTRAVAPLGAGGRGRHTTTHRELVALPGGALVVDTPGMREIRPWTEDGLSETFGDVAELAMGCRFRDCRHGTEPGCAVQASIARGTLDERRLESFAKLEREAAALAVRRDARAAADQKRSIKALSRAIRAHERSRAKR
jgi:ribosome biogenesis GTPase